MANKSIMTIQGLHKSFGSLDVLKGIDLAVHKGEIISIVGPSGSGKSTLLRSMNYLESVERGKMIFEERTHDMALLAEKEKQEIRKKLTMVFQQYNLFHNKTALENITEGLLMTKKMKREDATALAHHYLKKVNLSEKADSYPHQLSGGQQQRIGIARALAMEPEIILLDEPTSALDPELVGEVLKVIKEVAKENITMIIVTHEMAFAREISDRIIFMDEGKIQADELPETFFEQQKNPRINNFIQGLYVDVL